jgi:hypothetical protein
MSAHEYALLLLLAIVTISLIFFCFSDSINNDFTFDDSLAITGNKDIVASENIWINDIWGKHIRAHDSHKSYRPLLIKTFSLAAWDGLNATNFRLVSIAAHIAASYLVYLLSVSIIGNVFVSVGAALFFVFHPAHVEAVIAVVNMAEAFSSIFIISAYMIFSSSQNTSPNSKRKLSFDAIAWTTCTIIAILYKETALVSPLLIVARFILEMIVAGVQCFFSKFIVAQFTLSTKSSVLAEKAVWLVLVITIFYVYFAFRYVLINSKVDLNTASFFDIVSASLSYNIFGGLKDSYLSSSELIRKAENPFSFLSGTERTLSLLV